MTGLDQRGSVGAGLHHPRMPQPFIETLALQITPLGKRCWLIFAAGGQLLLEGCQFGKRRIGIDRAIAFAWRGAGRPLAMRRAAIALVASALVAATEITSAAILAAVAFVAIA